MTGTDATLETPVTVAGTTGTRNGRHRAAQAHVPVDRGPVPPPEPSETPISTHPNQPQYGPDGRPVGPEAGEGQDLLGSAPSHTEGQHPTSGPQQTHAAPPPDQYPPHPQHHPSPAQPSAPQTPPYDQVGPQQGYPGGARQARPGGQGGPSGPQAPPQPPNGPQNPRYGQGGQPQGVPGSPGGPVGAPTGGQAPMRPGQPPQGTGGQFPPHGAPTGGQPPMQAPPGGRPPYQAPTGGHPSHQGPGHQAPTGGHPGMGQASGPHVPPGQNAAPGQPAQPGQLPPGALPPGAPVPPHAPGHTGHRPGPQGPVPGLPPGAQGVPQGRPGYPGAPVGPPPGMPPGSAPPNAQQAYQAPPQPPAAAPPAPVREEPVFPPDAMGATQHISAVPPSPGGRPLFRDEVPDDAGVDTAQFDAQGVNDYDEYDGYDDDYQYGDGGTDTRARKRRIMMIAGFAVLLVLAGGGTFLLATSMGSGGANAATVADEADDPGALDAEALFPESMEVEGQGTFTRVAVEDTEDCAAGAHGDYGQVLADNECRQMVRASYLSEDEGHAVTVGVAAMPTGEEAAAAMEAQDLVATQWFAGLPGEEGSPAERLGHSGGHGSSGQWGRYLLFSLAANSDGTEEGGEGESATELRAISEGFLQEAHTSLSDNRG